MMVGPRWIRRLHASTISTPNSVHPTRLPLLSAAAAADDESEEVAAGRPSTSKSRVDRL